MRSRLAKKAIAVVAGTAALIVMCIGLLAQGQARPVDAKPKDTLVHLSADVTKTPIGDNKAPMLLKGNVILTHEDTMLKSDLVNYDRKANTAVSPGKITISDPECDISGEKGSADFKKKLGEIVGNVIMLVKPKQTEPAPADKDSLRAKMNKPTTITCPKLEYHYKSKIATLTGGVSFKQDKRTATAQKAEYDGRKEVLILTGDVNGVDEDGSTFHGPVVRISFKKGDEWIETESGTASFKMDLGEEDTAK